MRLAGGVRGIDVMSPGPDSPHRLDKHAVRRAFAKASGTYDETAVLQTEVRTRLIERLDYMRIAPAQIVDVGSGTGCAATELTRRYPGARLLQVDLSEPMLRQARERVSRWRRWRGTSQFVAADAECLPLADGSCDLVYSNLALQWCNDLEAALREFRRVLRPGGLLLFTSFGPDTLAELRQSWAQADGNVHVSQFVDMHDVGDAMVRAGLADPVVDAERLTLTYDTLKALMRDLKGIGAVNAAVGRSRGLTGKARMGAVVEAYERLRTDGRLPATYEVVYGHGWAPPTGANEERGTAEVALSELQRQKP